MSKIKRISKNVFVIMIILVFVMYIVPFNKSVAAANISIKGPSIVMEGQSAVFDVTYASNVIYINLSSGDVILNGFQATVSVSGSGNTRKVVLTNVRGTGSGRSITINRGTGYVGSEKVGAITSGGFTIKGANANNNNATIPVKPVTPTQNKPAVNNNANNNNNQNQEQNQNNKEEEKKEEEKKEEQPKEQEEINKEEENINYDEQIPIPNTGRY